MTDMKTITEIIESAAPMTLQQIIEQEISDWRRSVQRRDMLDGQRYYRMKHDILLRNRTIIGEGGRQVAAANMADNKLVHGYVRKLVDQKANYLLGKQPSLQTDNDAYAEQLTDVIGKEFWRLLKNLGKDAVINGKAWLQVYYDDTGRLSFKRIPAQEVIPLWRDAAHTELDALIRVYEVDYYEGRTKHVVSKVEYWDSKGVQHFTMDGPGRAGLVPDTDAPRAHFAVVDGDGAESGLNWERIPWICFKYNDDELPLIVMIRSLIDDYDRKRSDNSNVIEDTPNSIYVLDNLDGQDMGEFRRNLSTYRAIKLAGSKDYPASVTTLETNLDSEAFEKHMDALRKAIYEFGRGVDTQSDKLGSSPSGIALRFLFGDLDLDANDMENEFQAAFEQLLWFVDQHLANVTGADFSDANVDLIFNRDIPINETEAVTNAKSSAGIISQETIIANHPWTTDVKDEMQRLEDEAGAGLGADPYTQPPTGGEPNAQ
ncbi:phage portal protein, SPP1 family [Paenibacillaceae bacterium GAS479]|nr:phage portal protein, SPP1 family [Paenibacillaceae bacterium GAS479]